MTSHLQMSSFGSYHFIKSAYSSGSCSPNPNPSPIESDRNLILNSTIENLNILITPLNSLINETIDYLQQSFFNDLRIGSFLITLAASAMARHAAIVVQTNTKLNVLIEYGAYDERREGDYQGRVHYFSGHDGLRFVQLTDGELAQIGGNPKNVYFKCHCTNIFTIHELLTRTIFQNNVQNWDRRNYDIISHNCQMFVTKVIEVTHASSDTLDLRIPNPIRWALRRNLP